MFIFAMVRANAETREEADKFLEHLSRVPGLIMEDHRFIVGDEAKRITEIAAINPTGSVVRK